MVTLEMELHSLVREDFIDHIGVGFGTNLGLEDGLDVYYVSRILRLFEANMSRCTYGAPIGNLLDQL